MTNTILINKEHPMKEKDWKRFHLITIKNYLEKDIVIEEETYNKYQLLKEDLKKENIEIDIDNAFRSYETQEKLVQEYIKKYGLEYTNRYCAPPGCSEHHTGLAIDLVIKLEDGWLEDETIMEKEKRFQIIHQKLSKYGFILRYPKGKEKITGYSYEPWHIRYVGILPSKIMEKENLTLEEYLNDYSGILYINKEKGKTSFDIVNEIKHLFGIKRVGHSGTLDPIATGVLVVTIGKACKIVELLTSYDKEYIATMKLGISTDTLDITGNRIEEKEYENINYEKIINHFQKEYLQEVPNYSAIKVNGKKLYEYARKNEKIELPKKKVTIYEIKLLSQDLPILTFQAKVSKGCYIRSLIRDIARKANTVATMTKLERTRQGNISVEECVSVENITEKDIKKIEEVLNFPKIEVEEEIYKKIKNGVKLPNLYNIKDKVIFTYQKKRIGIYELNNHELKVWKNF